MPDFRAFCHRPTLAESTFFAISTVPSTSLLCIEESHPLFNFDAIVDPLATELTQKVSLLIVAKVLDILKPNASDRAKLLQL